MKKKKVVIGLLGTILDSAGPKEKDRWSRWRPTVCLCQQEDLLIHRFELLYQAKYEKLCQEIIEDIQSVSPETKVVPQSIDLKDPWDFEEVYGVLHDFAKRYPFNPDKEDYYIHITTGTHVAQICLFLLTEAHYFPGKLIQTSPPSRERKEHAGSYTIIDLDLSKYDRLSSRFQKEKLESVSFLKSGIETKNKAFNKIIERLEKVAISSKAPILLMGPTGAGKSKIACRVYELKKMKRQVEGEFVEVNCATLRGDGAMSALFGHVKGAFTGALQDRAGFLKKANQGILFLDEIGELGLDEQAMLLKALEEKRFIPLGSDKEVTSDFQLIAGTNKNLSYQVAEGKFREDLLARINLWAFELPALKERLEDIEPNLEYELEEYSRKNSTRITFNKEAKELFLKFATSTQASWKGNFRDLNAAITRMATLSVGGRINQELVREEIDRLKKSWQSQEKGSDLDLIREVLPKEEVEQIDLFDQVQLALVIKTCRVSKNLSEAGKILFSNSRERKKTSNDADRLSKYLGKFELNWEDLKKEAT